MIAPRLPYTIQPTPTVYRGCMYDSVLEARYAVLFDLFGWSWVYHRFEITSGKYRPIEPDFVIDTSGCNPWRDLFYSSGRRKWNRIIPDRDAILEVKPNFVTRESLKEMLRNDANCPFQLAALFQACNEGHRAIVCTGSLFDRDRKIESEDDAVLALADDFVDLATFDVPRYLLSYCTSREFIMNVTRARHFKFHLHTEASVRF